MEWRLLKSFNKGGGGDGGMWLSYDEINQAKNIFKTCMWNTGLVFDILISVENDSCT